MLQRNALITFATFADDCPHEASWTGALFDPDLDPGGLALRPGLRADRDDLDRSALIERADLGGRTRICIHHHHIGELALDLFCGVGRRLRKAGYRNLA